MASIIKARTFSTVVDNRIQLNNSSCARLWSTDIGTTWTHIRVCCRISMVDAGGALGSTPRFAFGIQSGTSNLFMDLAGPTHWAGFLSNIATWNRATNGGVLVNYSNTNSIAKKVGTTLTTGSNFDIVPLNYWDATVAGRVVFYLEITKGSPSFTFKTFGYTTNNGGVGPGDISVGSYLAQMVLTSPAFTFHGASSNVTLAVDEAANGFFNAVGFAWDRGDALIELSDVTVVKLP